MGVAVGIRVGVAVETGVAVVAGTGVGTGAADGDGVGVAEGSVGEGATVAGAEVGNGADVGVKDATTPGTTAVAAGPGDSLQLARTTARASSNGTRQYFNLTSNDSVVGGAAGAPEAETVAANNREYLDRGPPGDRGPAI
ncbi:MAG: hypothetical protein QF719_01230 [Chloroflexota bacterium]|nr:hypothetical protein [Chloroflexota bacterium]MDP6756831.1 hypothetical protein [Chloroflexota bacterium]